MNLETHQPADSRRDDSSELDTTAKDDNHIASIWKDVFIIVWKQKTTADAVSKIRLRILELADLQPDGIRLLTVIEKDAEMPSSTMRKALAGILADVGHNVQRSAVVFEGEGFKAAAVRSIVTGLSLLARQPYPHRVMASADLATELGEAGDASKLSDVLRSLRSA